MKSSALIALLGGLSWSAFASTITYTDQINNNLFASSDYTLIANNAKTLTTTKFNDGNTTTSAAEIPSTPDMRLPGAPDGILLAPGEILNSAVYDLSYEMGLVVNRDRFDSEVTPNRAQFDPSFNVNNQNFSVTLVIRDIGGGILQTIDVTSLNSVDLLPYLLDGGAIQNAFETNGIFLRTRFRADSVTFGADISGYNPSANPDRNVELDYHLRERLAANSSLTLDFSLTSTPEPASLAMMGLGLVVIAQFARKRTSRSQ